jgi:uncharacterized membrane protein
MTLIILGLLLWWGAHLFKRLAPARRAAMGDAGKGLVTVAVVAGVVLMVIGYRGNTAPDLWYPPAFLTHVNNLLMLFAIYLYAASGMKTRITRVIRHPQLTAVKAWAVAHLLVNGDLASVILFGGFLIYAVAHFALGVANGVRPSPEVRSGHDLLSIVIGVALYGVMAQLHGALIGVPVFQIG